MANLSCQPTLPSVCLSLLPIATSFGAKVIAVETDSWWEPGLFTIEVTRTPCTVEHRPGLGEESTHPIGHTLVSIFPFPCLGAKRYYTHYTHSSVLRSVSGIGAGKTVSYFVSIAPPLRSVSPSPLPPSIITWFDYFVSLEAHHRLFDPFSFLPHADIARTLSLSPLPIPSSPDGNPTQQETLTQDPTVVWLEPELAGIGVARTMQHGISQYVRRMQVSFLMPEQGSTAADGAAGSDVRDIYDGGATGMTSTTTEHPFLGDHVVRSTSKGHRVKEAYPSNGVLTMPDISAVADALGPWMLAAGRGLTTYAWMSRYWAPTRKGKTGTAGWTGCWVLLCLFGTLSPVLDSLFAKETLLPVFFLGWLLAASAWFTLLFLVNLAGSVVLALVNPTIVTWNMVWDVGLSLVSSTVVAASVFILAAIASIWIVVVDELWLERKQQVRCTLERRQFVPQP